MYYLKVTMPTTELEQRVQRLTDINNDDCRVLKSEGINGEDNLGFVEFQDLLLPAYI